MKNSFNTVCLALFSAILFNSCSKSTEDLTNNITVSASGSGSGTNTGASSYTYVTHMYGFKVVPTNSSNGHAVLTLEYNAGTKTANYSLTFERLTPTTAHIHVGLPTENGPVVFDLGTVAGNPHKGTIAISDAQAADLTSGRYYADVHTTMFPDGEVRGQIGKD